MEVRPGP